MKIIEFLKKHHILLILGFIVVFGLILRLWLLGESSMWIDESISSLAASKIIEKGFPVFDSGLLYGRAHVFHYLMAFFMLIFGINDFSSRFVSVLFGTGMIVLAYFIGKEFDKSNKVTGIMAALFVSVFFIEVVFSRQARFYQMFQFLFFLTIFFLYKSKENKKYAWFACLSFAILVDTHLAGLILFPFMLYIAYNHRDFKLSIIPIIISAYFASSLFYLNYETSSAANYIQDYSRGIYFWLRPFFFISLLGVPLAWVRNKKLLLLLILPSVVLFLSLIFLKVYALRYAYFIIPFIIIGLSLIFSFVFKHNKIYFIVILLFALIYPSNLIQEIGPLTAIKPENIYISSFSEPIINYKLLNESTKKTILNNGIVTLFTPAVEWYFKKPSYFIPFSLDGTDKGYFIYQDKDAYTGAEIFNFDSPQISKFILIEDVFGYSKLTLENREKLEDLKKKCLLIDNSESLKVYSCSI